MKPKIYYSIISLKFYKNMLIYFQIIIQQRNICQRKWCNQEWWQAAITLSGSQDPYQDGLLTPHTIILMILTLYIIHGSDAICHRQITSLPCKELKVVEHFSLIFTMYIILHSCIFMFSVFYTNEKHYQMKRAKTMKVCIVVVVWVKRFVSHIQHNFILY